MKVAYVDDEGRVRSRRGLKECARLGKSIKNID